MNDSSRLTLSDFLICPGLLPAVVRRMSCQSIVKLSMTSRFGRDTVNSLVIEGLYQHEMGMTKWLALKKLNLVEENTTEEELVALQMEYVFKIMAMTTAELSSNESAAREIEHKIHSEKILKLIGALIELWNYV